MLLSERKTYELGDIRGAIKINHDTLWWRVSSRRGDWTEEPLVCHSEWGRCHRPSLEYLRNCDAGSVRTYKALACFVQSHLSEKCDLRIWTETAESLPCGLLNSEKKPHFNFLQTPESISCSPITYYIIAFIFFSPFRDDSAGENGVNRVVLDLLCSLLTRISEGVW